MNQIHLTTVLTVLGGGLIVNTGAARPTTGTWPQFRGPNSQGVAESGKPPILFGLTQGLLWKTPISSGVSSPCIWGDRIFITAYDQEHKKLETLCLDRGTGKILWRKDAPTDKVEEVHEISSPANATPATDGKRVFVYFGTYGLVAYSFQGNVVWTKPLPPSRIGYGTGASPVVSDGALLLKVPLDDDSHLLAVRCTDGKTLWKSADPSFAEGWATPIMWRENGRTVVGVFNMGQFRVHDMKTGASVWWVAGTPAQACGTPAVDKGMVYITGTGLFGNKENLIKPPDFDELILKYDANKDGRIGTDELPDSLLFVNRGISSGIGSEPLSKMLKHGTGKDQTFDRAGWVEATSTLIQQFATNQWMKTSAFAVHTGGQGDATSNIIWSESKGVPEVPSPLLYRDRLYCVKNGGLFTCRDPKTGQSLYSERVGAEGGYFASPIAADGKIYLASDRGIISVLKAGDAFTLLSRAELKEGIMATPAIVEDKLYVRSAGHLWAFGK